MARPTKKVTAEIQALALQGLAILGDSRLDEGRKRVRLDANRASIKKLQDELENAKHVEGVYEELAALGINGSGQSYPPVLSWEDSDRARAKGNAELAAQRRGVTDARSTKGPRHGVADLLLSEDDLTGLRGAAEVKSPFALQTTKVVDSTGAPMAATPSYQMSPIYPYLSEGTRIMSYLPSSPMSNPSIYYFRALAGAVGAAPVSELGTKPTSSPTWSQVQATARKIAHVSSASDEVVNDFSAFIGFMSTQMIQGLVNAENDQILNGSGVAPALTGLLNTSGILVRARGTDSPVDAVLKARTDVRTGSTFSEADLIIMHPTDAQTCLLYKDSNGQYLAGSPLQQNALPELWGMSLVQTTQCPAGTSVVMNSQLGAHLYIREAPRFECNMFGGLAATDFATDTVAFRAEERIALATPRPSAIVKLTGM